MFDTMTLTKVTGAVCGSLLVYLLISWGAETLYTTSAGAGHDGEEMAQAYSIDTGASDAGEVAEADTGPAFADVYAAADIAAGEKVFAKCKACHKMDGTDGTGPHLNGVVGRAPGASAGFGYSDAMLAVAEPWTPEHLDAFLLNPKKSVPGTKMGFAGLPKIEDRANVIAYLASVP